MPMSLDPDVAYWSEIGEARAAADLTEGLVEGANRVGARKIEPGGGVAFTFTTVDIPFFNRAIGVGVGRRAVESDVDEIVAFYDDAARDVSVAQIAPHAG